VKLQLLHMNVDCEHSKMTAGSLRLELEHQKEATDKALKALKVSVCDTASVGY